MFKRSEEKSKTHFRENLEKGNNPWIKEVIPTEELFSGIFFILESNLYKSIFLT